MRNIGPKSRAWLQEVEVYELSDLQECGSIAVFQMIRQRHKASLNLLWALEGAVQDRDWRDFSEAEKRALQEQLRPF